MSEDDQATIAQLTDIITSKDAEIARIRQQSEMRSREHKVAMDTLQHQRNAAQNDQKELGKANDKLRRELAQTNAAALTRLNEDNKKLTEQNQQIMKLKETSARYTQKVLEVERLTEQLAAKERARIALSSRLAESETNHKLAMKSSTDEYEALKREAQQRFDEDQAAYIKEKSQQIQQCMTRGHEIEIQLKSATQLRDDCRKDQEVLNSKIEKHNKDLTEKLKEVEAARVEGRALAAECRVQVDSMQNTNRELTERVRMENAKYLKSAAQVEKLEAKLAANHKEHTNLMQNLQGDCFKKSEELEQRRLATVQDHEKTMARMKEEHTATVMRLKADMEKQEAAMQRLREEKRESEKALTYRGRAAVASLENKTKAFESQLKQCMNTRQGFEAKATKLQQEIDGNEAKITALNNKLVEQARTHTLASEKHNNEIVRLQSREALLTKQIASYKATHDEDMGKLSAAKAQHIKLTSDLNNVQSSLNQSRTKVDVCTKQVEEITKTAATCNDDMRRLRTQLKDTASSKSDAEAELARVKNELANLQVQYTSTRKELTEATKNARTLENKMSTLENNIRDCEVRVSGKNKEMASMDSARNAALRRQETLTSENEMCKAEHRKCTASVATAKESTAEAQRTIMALKRNIAKVSSDFEVSKADATKKLSAYEKAIQALRKENDELKRRR